MSALPPTPPGGPPASPPGGYPAGPPPGQYPPAYQPYPSQYPQPYPGQYQQYAPVHRRTAFLTVAQIITVIETLLYILIGIGIILLGTIGTTFVTSNLGNFSYNGIAYNLSAYTAVFIVAGIVAVVIGVLLLWASIRMGRPSNGARWVVIIWQILLLLGGVSALVNRGGTYGLVPLILSAIVLYALLIDPSTRRAFGGR